MEWDKILQYEDDIKEIAGRWSIRRDSTMYEDAIQNCMMVLHEKVDLDKATGPEKEYVRGAIWNIVEKFFRKQGRWDFTSLDTLLEAGFQVDTSRKIIWHTSKHYNRNE